MSSAADRRNHVLEGIAFAAKLARREPADVQLIAVSKTRSAEEIEALIDAGQRDFGESRVQEALAKWQPILLARIPDVRLHAVGRLQSNKAAEGGAAVRCRSTRSTGARFSTRSASEAEKAGRFPAVYIQVNIGEEEQKGGCPIGEVGDLVAAVRASPLPLAGLMCIPPLGLEPAPYFALLTKLARRHDVMALSMGMSADYKAGGDARRDGGPRRHAPCSKTMPEFRRDHLRLRRRAPRKRVRGQPACSPSC